MGTIHEIRFEMIHDLDWIPLTIDKHCLQFIDVLKVVKNNRAKMLASLFHFFTEMNILSYCKQHKYRSYVQTFWVCIKSKFLNFTIKLWVVRLQHYINIKDNIRTRSLKLGHREIYEFTLQYELLIWKYINKFPEEIIKFLRVLLDSHMHKRFNLSPSSF